MSAASVVARGRAAALALMVDTVTITRVTGQTTDLQTGAVISTTTTIYAGPGRIQRVPSGGSAPTMIGEAQRYQQPVTVQVPTTVAGVLVDDVVTVTASALDADLVGRTYWVKGFGAKTHTTMHRFECEEVAG